MGFQESVILKDHYFMTYVLFYALGTMTLIALNFFPTATDYWMYKFRNLESNESYNSEKRSHLQAEFTADYSIVSHVSSAVFIILTLLWIKKLPILVRTIMTLCGTVAVFMFTCIFVEVDTDSWQRGFMILTLLSGFVLTGFCGIFLVTLFEIAVKFPPKYLAVIFTGQALCGILSAVVQIISLSMDAGPIIDGFVYFLSGMVFVLLTLFAFLVSLKKSFFFKHYFWKEVKAEKIEVSKEKLLPILHKVKFYVLAILVSSASAVMIYPAVTSLVLSVHKGSGNKWHDVYFGPVSNFLVYCTSDYLGRELAMIIKKLQPSHGLILLGAASLRVVFVPVIMLCNAQPREHLPVVFSADYAYIIFIIVFASTNGFLVNLCIIQMAEIPTEEEKPLVFGFIMIFMIVCMAAFSFVGSALVQAL